MKTDIVKVQVAIGGHGVGSTMLVYDEHQTFEVTFDTDHGPKWLRKGARALLRRMEGRPKAYFNAEITKGSADDGADGVALKFLDEAEEQEW